MISRLAPDMIRAIGAVVQARPFCSGSTVPSTYTVEPFRVSFQSLGAGARTNTSGTAHARSKGAGAGAGV